VDGLQRTIAFILGCGNTRHPAEPDALASGQLVGSRPIGKEVVIAGMELFGRVAGPIAVTGTERASSQQSPHDDNSPGPIPAKEDRLSAEDRSKCA
jgi:hypothetical protein